MSNHNSDMAQGKDPSSLSHVLGRVLRQMKVSDQASAMGIFGHWRLIVGDAVADHAVPKKLEKRKLTVEVDDPAWATQLKFLESQLLTTLREHVGDEVESLDIRVRRSR